MSGATEDGKECEAFVVAIQDFAFSKGWDEDHSWMLRFAKTRLRGKALRWYTRLDTSIKKDWDLFVRALFDQYPLVEASDDARPYDASSEGQQIGILRIVTEEGTRLPQYVWRDYTSKEIKVQGGLYSYSFPRMTTVDCHEALIVSFLPSSAPHQIGCLASRIEAGAADFY
ncbi:hypothetical protein FS837_004006 [Tulasnella sp. UAMH 9824]|nr:hypothetical protein FS837_004006 [Tulasnella sp. UAMH 9824]